MTIIAFRNGLIAADSLSLHGEIISGTSKKIVKNKWGIKGGSAGETASCYRFRQWILDGAELSKIPDFENLEGLVYFPEKNKVFLVQDGKDRYYELEGEFFALGSGKDIAIGAMAAGATAKEAAEIAIKYCISCNGSVSVL